MTRAATGMREQRSLGIRAQLAMGAVSLALLGGVAMWHLGSGGVETAAPTAGSAMDGADTEAAAAMSEPAALSTQSHEGGGVPQTTRAGVAAQYLYLVDSPEQAAFVRRWSGELNDLRRAMRQQPVSVSVLVTEGLDPAVIRDLPGPYPGWLAFDLRTP